MNKVGNVEVSVAGGIELNDKDYCICLLSTLKEMQKNYVVAMTEASNEWLFNIYHKMFESFCDMQRKLYQFMFQQGWYQLEAVSNNKLSEKYQMLNDDYKKLSE